MAKMKIKLTRGKFAIVDASDYPWLIRKIWHYAPAGGAVTARPKYEVDALGGTKKLLMHRYILDAPDGLDVDHINGNHLDNRRCNLRIATRSQNICNSRNRPNKWGMRGIYFHTQTNKFVARITVNRKTRIIGQYKTALAARRAYCKAAREVHREFAYRVNR